MEQAVQGSAVVADAERPAAAVNMAVKLTATFFYSGYLPKAPGTWAAGFTTIILFFIWPELWVYQLIAIVAVFVLGSWVSGKAEDYFGHDGRPIVIDEVLGQMVALFMAPPKFVPFVLGFLFFRFFDVVKPPPVRQWESFRRGWGVMADDLAAGFYAACLMQFIIALLEKWNINYI
jgi:phosphatidylglycerophosphatase A